MMKKIRYLNKKKGFTLVEIIIVLVILAILAALLIPALTGYIDKSKEKAAISEARGVFTAAQTTLSECYAMNKQDVLARISQNMQTLNGVSVGRVTNFMLNQMQHVAGNEDAIYDAYGWDARIGVQVLKYLNSYTNGSAVGSTDDPQYQFPDNVRMDGKTPAEFRKSSKSDIGVTIMYNTSGKIEFFQMIKDDYLITIYKDEIKVEKGKAALKCPDKSSVTYTV